MTEKIADRVSHNVPWLDPVADTLQQTVKQTVGSGGSTGVIVMDALHGRWLGHPLHPALTAIPLGAWTATLVLDAAGMEQGADLSLGLGLVGGLGAALAGLADWSETAGEERRIGLLHAILNTLGLALNLTSLVLRRTGARRNGVLLSTIAYAVGNVSAFLGGELAYDKGVGVNHTAWQNGAAEFTPALEANKLQENVPVRGMADGVPVVLVKRGDRIAALAATCTHAGGPLDQGTVEGDTIICPWHGSTFRLEDGRVVHGPATMPEPCYEARVRAGKVEVRRRV